MTALPEPPGRLLTVDAYVALGEDDRYRPELQEGNLVMSPSPAPDHMIVMGKLFVQLDEQLPPGAQVIPDVDVDLELAPRGKPGFVRRPDLVVAHRVAVDRVRRNGGILRACDVPVVIEIVSPGSQRIDHVIKRGEYADAGIPHYWDCRSRRSGDGWAAGHPARVVDSPSCDPPRFGRNFVTSAEATRFS
ncbi:MAG: Uma2 family endonuclease [Pseudonocardiaceae bacterium]